MSQPSASFLSAWLYGSPSVAERERSHYAARCWHPVAATASLAPGEALACELLGQPLLLTRQKFLQSSPAA